MLLTHGKETMSKVWTVYGFKLYVSDEKGQWHGITCQIL